MKISEASIKFGVLESKIYQWVKQGYLPVLPNEGRNKWTLTDESIKLLPLMKKYYDESRNPKQAFQEAAKKLGFDLKRREISKMLESGREFISELCQKDAPSLYETKPVEKIFSKNNRKTKLGLNGIEVGYRDHVVIIISSDFGNYEDFLFKIAKTGEKNGEHVWYFLSDNRKQKLVNEFESDKTQIFDWAEYEYFLKESKLFKPEILVPVLGSGIIKKIKKGADKFRLVFETSSKVLDYIKNPEAFFSYERNYESAISKYPINVLNICIYMEKDIVSLKKKICPTDFLKEIIHSHDKLFYLSEKKRIFHGMEAVFYLFEENFAGIKT